MISTSSCREGSAATDPCSPAAAARASDRSTSGTARTLNATPISQCRKRRFATLPRSGSAHRPRILRAPRPGRTRTAPARPGLPPRPRRFASSARCGRGAPLDHRQNYPPLERPARQLAPRRVHRLEERGPSAPRARPPRRRRRGRRLPGGAPGRRAASHPSPWSLNHPRLPCPK